MLLSRWGWCAKLELVCWEGELDAWGLVLEFSRVVTRWFMASVCPRIASTIAFWVLCTSAVTTSNRSASHFRFHIPGDHSLRETIACVKPAMVPSEALSFRPGQEARCLEAFVKIFHGCPCISVCETVWYLLKRCDSLCNIKGRVPFLRCILASGCILPFLCCTFLAWCTKASRRLVSTAQA